MILSVTSEKQTPSFKLFALCFPNPDAAVSDSLRPLKSQILKVSLLILLALSFPFLFQKAFSNQNLEV